LRRAYGLPVAMVLLGLVVGCGQDVASGQDEPQAVKTDLTTPEAAAKSFVDALEKGNADAAKAAAVATPEQATALEAMSEAMSGFRKLNEAAVARWGEAGKQVAGDMQDMDISAKLDKATVSVEGDTATLRTEDEEDEPLKLRRVDGQWKVDLSAMMGDEDISQAVPMFRAMGKAAREVGGEIAEGKFQTAEEAQQAMAMRMLGAMFGAMGDGAPPQPAPQPAPGQ
jgi:hypothetical protein